VPRGGRGALPRAVSHSGRGCDLADHPAVHPAMLSPLPPPLVPPLPPHPHSTHTHIAQPPNPTHNTPYPQHPHMPPLPNPHHQLPPTNHPHLAGAGQGPRAARPERGSVPEAAALRHRPHEGGAGRDRAQDRAADGGVLGAHAGR